MEDIVPLSMWWMKRIRSFHISEDLNVALKKRAAEDNVRFSDIVEAALKEYLAKKKK